MTHFVSFEVDDAGKLRVEAEGMDLFTVARLVSEFAHAWTVLDDAAVQAPPPDVPRKPRKANGFPCGEHCPRVFSTERGRSKHLNHVRRVHQQANDMRDPRLAVVNGVITEDAS